MPKQGGWQHLYLCSRIVKGFGHSAKVAEFIVQAIVCCCVVQCLVQRKLCVHVMSIEHMN